MRRAASTLSVATLLFAACANVEPSEDSRTAFSQHALEGAESELCPVPGTLAYHLSQGVDQGADNDRFRYDPIGTLIRRIRGRYDESTGAFRWRERFDSASTLAHRIVTGEATIVGGDQDLRYQVTTEDDTGAIVSVKEVEELWTGCQVERRTRPAGGTDAQWLAHYGSYADSVYQYIEEQPPHVYAGAPKIEVNGTAYADGTWVEWYEGSPRYMDYYQTRTGNADGYQRVDWVQDYGDGIFRGTDEFFIDGTQHRYYYSGSDGDCPPSWVDFTVDRQGYGTGTGTACFVTGEGEDEWPALFSCTLTLAPGSCTQTCDNGVTQACYFGRAG